MTSSETERRRFEIDDYKNADMYSFSVLLWELIHRIPPWKGLENHKIIQEVANGHRPAIEAINDQDE